MPKPTRKIASLIAMAAFAMGQLSSPGMASAQQDTPDLEAAALPSEWTFTASSTSIDIAPPEPIQPLPIGSEMGGTLQMSETCAGADCSYTTVVDVTPLTVIGESPAIEWVHQGTRWTLAGTTSILSSSTDQSTCIYTWVENWDITITDAVFDGERWIATAFNGTRQQGSSLDPSQSTGFCSPYQDLTTWTATGSAVVTPAEAPVEATTTLAQTTTTTPSDDPRDSGRGNPYLWGIAIVAIGIIILLGGTRIRNIRGTTVGPPQPPDPDDPPQDDPRDQHVFACGWYMWYHDDSDQPVTELKSASPGTECCKYTIQLYTTIVESDPSETNDNWFAEWEIEYYRANGSSGGYRSMPHMGPVIRNDTRTRSLPIPHGLGITGVADVDSTQLVNPDRADSIEEFNSINAAQGAAERSSSEFTAEANHEETTTLRIRLDRGCQREPGLDHVYEMFGESDITYSGDIRCHNSDTSCPSSMTIGSSGMTQVSNDLEYEVDNPAAGTGTTADAAGSWQFTGGSLSAGGVGIGTDGSVTIGGGVGPAELELEFSAPTPAEHNVSPAPLRYTGSNRDSHSDPQLEINVRNKYANSAEAEIHSGLNITALTDIRHHLVVQGSTRATPGEGTQCGCGLKSCNYCHSSFTLMIGDRLDPPDEGDRSTRDTETSALLDGVRYERHGEAELTADAILIVGPNTWYLNRPDSGEGPWEVTHG